MAKRESSPNEMSQSQSRTHPCLSLQKLPSPRNNKRMQRSQNRDVPSQQRIFNLKYTENLLKQKRFCFKNSDFYCNIPNDDYCVYILVCAFKKKTKVFSSPLLATRQRLHTLRNQMQVAHVLIHHGCALCQLGTMLLQDCF